MNLYTLSDASLVTILQYKFWTSLTITSHHIESEKFNKFLLRLLNECHRLEKLKIYWEIVSYSQFHEVFPAFVKSNLKILDVEIDDRRLLLEESEHLWTFAEAKLTNLPENHTITNLSVYNHLETDLFTSAFLNGYFLEVCHLEVIRANLSMVFKTMVCIIMYFLALLFATELLLSESPDSLIQVPFYSPALCLSTPKIVNFWQNKKKLNEIGTHLNYNYLFSCVKS